MAKNKKFKHKYVIEVEGITTNHFMENLFDDLIRGVMSVFCNQHKQFSYKLYVEENDNGNAN